MLDLASEKENRVEKDTKGKNLIQMVVFELGDQAFAVDVDSVREIIKALPVRAIPQTPPSLSGVATIRGEVLPVIDLGKFLGLESTVTEDEKKFIIMEFEDDSVKAVLAVDTVRRIYNISADKLDYTLKGTFMGDNLSCVIKQEGENILMPDFGRIIGTFRLETLRLSQQTDEEMPQEPEAE